MRRMGPINMGLDSRGWKECLREIGMPNFDHNSSVSFHSHKSAMKADPVTVFLGTPPLFPGTWLCRHRLASQKRSGLAISKNGRVSNGSWS